MTLSAITRKVGAGLVLLLLLAIVLKFAVGILTGFFFAVLGVVLLLAAIWALNALL